MGLAGDGNIKVSQTVDIAGYFFCPHNDEDLFVRPDLADHSGQVSPYIVRCTTTPPSAFQALMHDRHFTLSSQKKVPPSARQRR